MEDWSDADWLVKEAEISELFSPHAPVRESDLFAGRSEQMDKLFDAVFQAGQHIVIYGDRGVGKTSIVNAIKNIVFSASKTRKFFVTQCFDQDGFVSIWERALRNHQWDNGQFPVDEIDSSTGPSELLDLVEKFNANNRPVFVFDEFDRVSDPETKKRMAESIKLFSDRAADATVVIVGVGRTIRDLLSEHESIQRALKQIEMPRMSEEEIRDVIKVRLTRAQMEISSQGLALVVLLARGMPGYAHLLGRYSAKEAIHRKSLEIGPSDVLMSLSACLEEAGESTRYGYLKAVRSAHPNNLLSQALCACAIAPQDEFGSFKASDLKGPYGAILGRPVIIQDFARHLAAFCSEGRGPIIEQDGGPKNYRYRFIDPMMQSYVIMRGFMDELIPMDTKSTQP
jgi:GTPase SAR1 family protein